jgi:hypothetical protein
MLTRIFWILKVDNLHQGLITHEWWKCKNEQQYDVHSFFLQFTYSFFIAYGSNTFFQETQNTIMEYSNYKIGVDTYKLENLIY